MNMEQAGDIAFGSSKKIHMDKGTAVMLLVMAMLLIWCGCTFYDMETHYYPTQEEREECKAHGGWLLLGLPQRCIQPDSEIFYRKK